MKDRVRPSFIETESTTPLQDPSLRGIASSEDTIFRNLQRYQLNMALSGAKKVITGELCLPEEAAALATVHGMAVFCTLTPDIKKFAIGELSLPSSIYRASALKRQLKYFELQGKIKRNVLGGDKLLLGCGTLFDDAYALTFDFDQIKIKKLVDFNVSEPDSDDKRVFKRLRYVRDHYLHKVLLDGKIVGIDNYQRLLEIGLKFCMGFSISAESHLEGANAFLDRDDRQYNLITMFRLDPNMTGLKFQDQKAFLIRVLDRLKPGGQIIITIGSGNTNYEEVQRQETIRVLANISKKLGLQIYFHKNNQDPNCKNWNNGDYMDLQTLIITKD